MSFEHFIINVLNRRQRPKVAVPSGRDLVLGTTDIQGRREPVILPEEARPRHLAIMGLTGTGKSCFIENLVRQDIVHGTGFALFDVHGDLADSVVAYLAGYAARNEAILERVVLIEPFDATHTIGFNPLERTARTSAFFQAQELAHILHTHWETRSFGARTEELLRASLYTLSAHDLTLVELQQLLTSQPFLDKLVDKLEDPAVVNYWKWRYAPMSDRMKAAVREPILSRVSAFLADPQIRRIVGQRKSTFSFHDAITKGLYVVINLSKGKLGENSAVLGGLLFTKLALDVMAQAHTPADERRLFAVYADELQNLADSHFATLIAEARKYHIAFTAGHQFWEQLSPEMRGAMLGVGSRVFFRLHHRDALQLAGELGLAERSRYAAVLAALAPRYAVFRTGSERPVEFRVDTREDLQATALEIERIRDHSRALWSASNAALRRDAEASYRKKSDPEITSSTDESETDV